MSIILQAGSKGEEAVLLQKALNELGGFTLSKDGDFGPGTRNALAAWQERNGYPKNGVYDSSVHLQLSELIDRKYIRMAMVDEYADAIGISRPFLRAVTEVESHGSGFFDNGSCAILFERHIFFNQVTNKFGRKRADEWAAKYPNICAPTPSQSAYYGGIREWDRLDFAKNLDAECALLSASYGMFQIMGFNHNYCGYDSVGAYVADMTVSEKFHVGAVAMFIRNQPRMWTAARDLDYNEFARQYNGKRYAEHNYHGRLKKAHDFYAKNA